MGTSIRRQAAILFDYSRGRQALLSVAQPALGAWLAAGGFPGLRVTLLGLVAATAGFLSVFALNDLLDRRADAEAVRIAADQTVTAPRPFGEGPAADVPGGTEFDLDVAFMRHPLAQGALSLREGVLWVTGLGLVSLVTAFLIRPVCALLFAACVCLEALYCGLRRRSWLKFLPAGIMVGLGGLAGWLAVGTMGPPAGAFFALLLVWEIAGRNLSNDLADRHGDALVGITTVATVFGPAASRVGILTGALIIPFVGALQQGTALLRALLGLACLATMTVPAIRLWRRGEADAQRYFNQASLLPPLALVLALSESALRAVIK
jgi:4-hydroxybenzoate polyprenyltransferase